MTSTTKNGTASNSHTGTAAAKDTGATKKPEHQLQTEDNAEKESGPCGLPKNCSIL